MKRSFLVGIFCCLLLVVAVADAQTTATTGTGVIGFSLNSYGRARASVYPYSSTLREVDRMSLLVALSQNMVFDHAEDSDTTTFMAQLVTVPKADSAIATMADNEYTHKPPKVRIRYTLLGWKDARFFIARYTVINDTSVVLPVHIGAVMIPRVGGSYGGETVKYDAVKKVTYFYREGTASYWGLKPLGKDPYSVKIMDWDNYSIDPNADAATDSLRYAMTAGTGFDPDLTAGSNGSIYNVNAGQYTIAVGDSVEIYYAVSYGTTAEEMLTGADAASVRYVSFVTSVRPLPSATPEAFALEQNYPNPFNPSTSIEFALPAASHAILRVSDALGREVATLVNAHLEPGRYQARFDASRIGSGTYYYTLIAGNHASTRRMMLVK